MLFRPCICLCKARIIGGDVICGSAVSGPVNASALLVACLVRGDTAARVITYLYPYDVMG